MMKNSEQFEAKVMEVTEVLTTKVFAANKRVTDDWGHAVHKLFNGRLKGYSRKKVLLSIIGREDLGQIQLAADILPYGETKELDLPMDASIELILNASQQILTHLQDEAESLRFRNRKLRDIIAIPPNVKIVGAWLLSQTKAVR